MKGEVCCNAKEKFWVITFEIEIYAKWYQEIAFKDITYGIYLDQVTVNNSHKLISDQNAF